MPIASASDYNTEINKWCGILYHNKPFHDGPFCQKFWTPEDCAGCPVREATGFDRCGNTDFVPFCQAMDGADYLYDATDKRAAREYALKFIIFLRKLRREAGYEPIVQTNDDV